MISSPSWRLRMQMLSSFDPEMVYFANFCVNLRDHLCDVARHVSAQSLDSLDLDEIPSFLNRKRQCGLIYKNAFPWMDTIAG